jgi:cobalamin-dependent methionine synthase I
MTDQEKIVGLLGGSKIGVSLTETYQLVPEFSTTA